MKVTLYKNKDWLFSQEAFFIYSACMYQPTYGEYRKMMEHFISEPYIKIFVCEVNHREEGILVLDNRTSDSEIIGIAVSENCRHNGIGQYMIQQVMDLVQPEVLSAQTDDDAVGFYYRCGFTVETVIKEYPNGAVNRYNCQRNIYHQKEQIP